MTNPIVHRHKDFNLAVGERWRISPDVKMRLATAPPSTVWIPSGGIVPSSSLESGVLARNVAAASSA